ncbi:hypothetical protein [Stenotrophomonas sp. PD6]|uniref:hypothetical protein n=1 Tax=Stenotrophomonas sp. PD6 TaxID=3368612 RepID=UPI003B9FD6EA
MFSDASGAEAKAEADYLKKGGWDEPQVNSPWNTRCGQAEVSKTSVVYYPFPAKWWGTLTFKHICQAYRPDGLSPPGVPYEFARSIQIRAVCKEGFSVKDYNTGECHRLPSACPGYPENSQFGCGKSVAELEADTKGPIDPRRLFHAQQTCIAKKSCQLRCQMDNCKWMELVIPAFVDPYLGGENLWPFVEGLCSNFVGTMADMGVIGKWIADRECFSTMGWYHVQVDLKNALTQYGCGSQNDWDLVGQQIVPCLRETQPHYPQLYYEMGGIFVQYARERVRQQCRANRPNGSLDINTEIAGKVCAVGQ